jgi:hypothetical protein
MAIQETDKLSIAEISNLIVTTMMGKSVEESSIGTFDDFVQNIFSKSYPQFDFNTWHIRKIAHIVDEVIANPTSKSLLAVLPRYHLKSTILGYASSIYRMLTTYGDGMYVSYKDELASYHLSNIKNCIRGNQFLNGLFYDNTRQSDSTINYKIGNRRSRIFGTGILAMKRGIHTDTITICDDILGDLQNPMILTELEKVKRLFEAEIVNIPNKNCPMFVFGTVIDYSDLLYSLRDNPNFTQIWLPAMYPDPEHEVLWETQYDKEWLMRRRGTTSGEWRAFSTEFLLTPVMATEAYISRDEIDKVIDKTLMNNSMHKPYSMKGDQHIVAGLDIGKRRNPSHLSVFISDENDNLINIHQAFWDGLDYNKQIELVNTAIDNFHIDKLYWDATRGELEDRNLNTRVCVPVKFTGRGERNQTSYATDLAKRVELKSISLIDDDRFISQIICVNGDLKAPSSPMGHADSFWSCALAIGAYQDYYSTGRKLGVTGMGNIQTLVNTERMQDKKNMAVPVTRIDKFKDERVCKICGSLVLTELQNGKRMCPKCFTTW